MLKHFLKRCSSVRVPTGDNHAQRSQLLESWVMVLEPNVLFVILIMKLCQIALACVPKLQHIAGKKQLHRTCHAVCPFLKLKINDI